MSFVLITKNSVTCYILYQKSCDPLISKGEGTMPELPEVEVTKRGVEKVLVNHKIEDVFIGKLSLRVPMSDDLKKLIGATVIKLERRSKYIIVFTTQGSIIIHLGMTGHLSIVDSDSERILHDHFELKLDSHTSVRYNDARRFGLVAYVAPNEDPYEYKPLKELGPEPLLDSFTAEVLLNNLKRRKLSIKQALLNSAVVVGVGNIYASEVLFACKINPCRLANTISKEEAELLVTEIKRILTESIAQGGTTIRDFEGADGKLGYFVQNLQVYGHCDEPCKVCGTKIKRIVQGNRSTFFCPNCQK